jgi:hypothetical protein
LEHDALIAAELLGLGQVGSRIVDSEAMDWPSAESGDDGAKENEEITL